MGGFGRDPSLSYPGALVVDCFAPITAIRPASIELGKPTQLRLPVRRCWTAPFIEHDDGLQGWHQLPFLFHSDRQLGREVRVIIYPISGKFVAIRLSYAEGSGMSEPSELADLVDYLARTSRLTHSEAVRLIDEVLSFLDERPEEFVCRRHRALQAEGVPNSQIYARLRAELARWRFRAPGYSERQIRRLIYG